LSTSSSSSIRSSPILDAIQTLAGLGVLPIELLVDPP
jgi:hypothetical protein